MLETEKKGQKAKRVFFSRFLRKMVGWGKGGNTQKMWDKNTRLLKVGEDGKKSFDLCLCSKQEIAYFDKHFVRPSREKNRFNEGKMKEKEIYRTKKEEAGEEKNADRP